MKENQEHATSEEESKENLKPFDLSLKEYTEWIEVDDTIETAAGMTEDVICTHDDEDEVCPKHLTSRKPS